MDEFANWMIRAAFADQLAQTRSQLRTALIDDVVTDVVIDEWIDHLVQTVATMAIRSLSRDLSATLMIKGIAVADPTSSEGRARLAPYLADLGVRFQREYPEGVRLRWYILPHWPYFIYFRCSFSRCNTHFIHC